MAARWLRGQARGKGRWQGRHDGGALGASAKSRGPATPALTLSAPCPWPGPAAALLPCHGAFCLYSIVCIIACAV